MVRYTLRRFEPLRRQSSLPAPHPQKIPCWVYFLWVRRDSNPRRRKPADLQSAAIAAMRRTRLTNIFYHNAVLFSNQTPPRNCGAAFGCGLAPRIYATSVSFRCVLPIFARGIFALISIASAPSFIETTATPPSITPVDTINEATGFKIFV